MFQIFLTYKIKLSKYETIIMPVCLQCKELKQSDSDTNIYGQMKMFFSKECNFEKL